ncbi:MAG: MBL fold metallo-hydrolase [Cyclobacteriaceae bacterium]|nr:MBL fold metallo-hydrolase [Cyclobacteriaceae bacterium]
MSLKVTFLGTGTSQGVPVIACNCRVCSSGNSKDNRLRTSALIETDGHNILIDSGPDFRYQILRAGITHLDAILFTHQHRDHIAGLDDIRSFNFKQKKAMPIYGNDLVIDQIKREFHYVFENKYPGVPQLEIHQIDNRPFLIGDLAITPIEVLHHKLPVLGFRIKNFTYITDANTISEKEIAKIRGSKTLVINALQRDNHISHFTLEEALKIIDIIQPENAFLIHISHKLGLHDEVSKELPPNVNLAYDGLTITI